MCCYIECAALYRANFSRKIKLNFTLVGAAPLHLVSNIGAAPLYLVII